MLKRLLCALLTAILILSGCAGLAEALPAAAPEAAASLAVYDDGTAMLIDGNFTGEPVTDIDQAEDVLKLVEDRIGLDPAAHFEPWRTLEDTAGNRYYVFQAFYGDTTMSGNAAKVITDRDGTLLGVTASVDNELPEGAYTDAPITAGDAETVVSKQVEGDTIVTGSTGTTILPLLYDVDMDSENEKEESRRVYVVYTESADEARPFTAHYVTFGGEYLYSLPVKAIGDEAALAGYDGAYVFDDMEPADFTGTAKRSDGTEMEISLPLMRDRNTGKYVLGNLERRIIVADCYDMLYNHNVITPETRDENAGWDDSYLITLYNYCRAWDYYSAIGWIGGDGLGTPIMILKDFCDKEHNPVDNAAYAGEYYGFQLFLSSDANDMGQCLDVLAHEFTHCVTHTAMTHNGYKNDFGAINESMSDVQGNLCEMLNDATEDTTWLMGENSRMAVRSMSNPHRYRQPEYSWDLYYIPEVRDPSELNDRGGVHGNSSLMNNLAYRLCADGMTYEEARALWFAVDLTMVPGSDYAQLRHLLPWVMDHVGLGRYQPALIDALDATRLGQKDTPEVMPADRAMVTFELPDEEKYTRGNWMLILPTASPKLLIERFRQIVNRQGKHANDLDELADIARGFFPDNTDAEGNLKLEWKELYDRATGLVATEKGIQVSPEDKALLNRLADWLRGKLEDAATLTMGYAAADGRTVEMVTAPGTTIPIMLELEFEPNSTLIKSVGLGVWFMGEWHDLSGSIEALTSAEPQEGDPTSDFDLSALGIPGLDGLLEDADTQSPTEIPEGEVQLPTVEEINAMLDDAESFLDSMSWLTDLFFYNIPGGKITALPDKGFDTIGIVEGESVRNLLNIVGANKS